MKHKNKTKIYNLPALPIANASTTNVVDNAFAQTEVSSLFIAKRLARPTQTHTCVWCNLLLVRWQNVVISWESLREIKWFSFFRWFHLRSLYFQLRLIDDYRDTVNFSVDSFHTFCQQEGFSHRHMPGRFFTSS